ncbi:MAG: hypothetical protein AAF723_04640, partial [Pseudomonadota bacterium]
RKPEPSVPGTQPIKDHEWEDPLTKLALKTPASLINVSQSGISEPTLMKGATYIWVISEAGDLIMALEENLEKEPRQEGELALGHPNLVQGQEARIGGELICRDGEWIIWNKSGRYGKRPNAMKYLPNVKDLFKDAGLGLVEYQGMTLVRDQNRGSFRRKPQGRATPFRGFSTQTSMILAEPQRGRAKKHHIVVTPP